MTKKNLRKISLEDFARTASDRVSELIDEDLSVSVMDGIERVTLSVIRDCASSNDLRKIRMLSRFFRDVCEPSNFRNICESLNDLLFDYQRINGDFVELSSGAEAVAESGKDNESDK